MSTDEKQYCAEHQEYSGRGGSEMVVDSKYGLGIMMNMNYRGGIKNLLNIKKSF